MPRKSTVIPAIRTFLEHIPETSYDCAEGKISSSYADLAKIWGEFDLTFSNDSVRKVMHNLGLKYSQKNLHVYVSCDSWKGKKLDDVKLVDLQLQRRPRKTKKHVEDLEGVSRDESISEKTTSSDLSGKKTPVAFSRFYPSEISEKFTGEVHSEDVDMFEPLTAVSGGFTGAFSDSSEGSFSPPDSLAAPVETDFAGSQTVFEPFCVPMNVDSVTSFSGPFMHLLSAHELSIRDPARFAAIDGMYSEYLTTGEYRYGM